MFMLLFFNFIFSALLLAIPVGATTSGEHTVTINHKLYLTSEYGGIIVMGEVINNLETAISKVNVTITFYDENEQELKKVNCSTFLEVIPVGRRAAFKYFFKNEDVENFKRYDVKVSSYMASEPKPMGFSITSARTVLYPNFTRVTGIVENTISSSIKYLNIFALLYDENGFIAVTDSDLTIIELKSGATDYFVCETNLINDTFNVVKCIITGESENHSVQNEKIITSVKTEDGFNYTIAIAIIIGITLLISSLLLLKKRRKKRKKKIRRRL
jgi:hypothetical protein